MVYRWRPKLPQRVSRLYVHTTPSSLPPAAVTGLAKIMFHVVFSRQADLVLSTFSVTRTAVCLLQELPMGNRLSARGTIPLLQLSRAV